MTRLRLSSSRIVAEVIDGEAIILDLKGGSYFATDGVGAVAWSAALDGHSIEQLAESASTFYADHPTAGTDVAALLDGFVDAGLLVVDESDDGTMPSTIEWPLAYSAPALERHDDLQSMMQIDPIHETDVSGWPAPAPKSGS
jgi:hypothetical protein